MRSMRAKVGIDEQIWRLERGNDPWTVTRNASTAVNIMDLRGRIISETESEYLLSQYKFIRKYVLRCTVGNRIINRLIF